MAVIDGYATLLQNPEVTENRHNEYLNRIIANTQRLSFLTSNILELSKLNEADDLTPQETTQFRLDEQIRTTILLDQQNWQTRNIDFDLDMDQISFTGNKILMTDVWLNLIENALKYSPNNRSIQISLKQIDNEIKFQITNYGPTINRLDQERIFEQFFQSESHSSSQGNGLGLSLVKKIVTLHRGNVAVQSNDIDGTTFTVNLPTE